MLTGRRMEPGPGAPLAEARASSGTACPFALANKLEIAGGGPGSAVRVTELGAAVVATAYPFALATNRGSPQRPGWFARRILLCNKGRLMHTVRPFRAKRAREARGKTTSDGRGSTADGDWKPRSPGNGQPKPVRKIPER